MEYFIYLNFLLISCSNLQVLRNGKPMSDLKVDLRYLPVSKPTKADDGSIIPAIESSKLYIDRAYYYGRTFCAIY